MKLLYIMHVPWGWIKQRPHFFAEELSKKFEIVVAEKRVLNPGVTKKFTTNQTCVSIIKFFALPIYNPLKKSNKLFDIINEILLRFRVRFKKYDYIWVTSVLYYYKIKNLIPSSTILIYDCMDDEMAFPQKKFNVKIFKETERDLLNRANFVFCSANNLVETIKERSGIKRKYYVINNASSFPGIESKHTLNPKFNLLKSSRSLLYIGTISDWFDFDSVIMLLEAHTDLHLYLVGPVDTHVPNHERIHVLGSCEHRDIWGLMQSADVLVMPFIVIPLIESVNPVKLYEYIWSQKPIIATRYKESEKFEDFVYLYSSKQSLGDIYDTIVNNQFQPKNRNLQSIKDFISQNTWEERGNVIYKLLCQ